MKMKMIRLAVASVAGAACLLMAEPGTMTGSGSLVSQASAIIGRPLTPVSYAGVARRTTRRAVVGGAVVGGAVVVAPGAVVVAPAPVVVVPTCVQAVDVYGRIYTRC
jgi:Na+/proline symporter